MNPKNNDPSLDYGCYPTLAPLKQTAVRSGIADREGIIPWDKTQILYGSILPVFFVEEGTQKTICGTQIIAGRLQNSTLYLNSTRVSRRHAMFELLDSTWYLSDLHSKNGTLLNGCSLEPDKKYYLCAGDRITLADRTLIFDYKEFHPTIPADSPLPHSLNLYERGICQVQLPSLTLEYVYNTDTRILGEDSDPLILNHASGSTYTLERSDIDIDTKRCCILSKPGSQLLAEFSYLDIFTHKWFLTDCGSGCGIMLNGKRIDPYVIHPLTAGDIICFGDDNWFTFGKLPVAAPEKEANGAASKNAKHEIIFADDQFPAYHLESQQLHTYSGKRILAGRSEICLLRLTSDSTEDIHAVFEHEGSSWYLYNTTSTNNTYINGKCMDTRVKYPLRFDDEIAFGDEKIVFHPVNNLPEKNSQPQDSDSELHPGSVVAGKYQIVRQLSSDIVAKTYLVDDLRLQKKWVIKVVEKKSPTYKAYKREILMNTVRMMRDLYHPMANNLVDFIDDEDYVITVLEYIQGEDLLTTLKKKGPFSAEDVIDIGLQMCDVLGYLHNRRPRRIHRDIKPSNIMRQPDGRIKLIDFDIMICCESEQTKAAAILGTKGYAAPEQYQTTTELTPATDIYALGVTLHQLVTGQDPMTGKDIVPICRIDPRLPKKLERILEKCVQKDPDMRYRNCAELQSDLEKAKAPKRAFPSWFSL